MADGRFTKGGKPGPGRPSGLPNKATQQAREAIARFVDGNAHRLQEWLDKVAEGVKTDEGKYIVAPDPEKAFSLFQSVIEYHVPKLARQEITGKDGEPIETRTTVDFSDQAAALIASVRK